MKTPDFMSYERYKKKKTDNSKNGVLVGITTFFIALLFFTVVAKSLSPDVDVSIGDDSQTDVKETGLGVKKFIDERLKMIQMEDNSAGVSVKLDNKRASKNEDNGLNRYFQDEEEKVTIPKNGESEDSTYEEEPIRQSAVTRTPPRPSARELSTPFESPRMTKVYVGRYSTVDQAKVAQEILTDAGLGVTPFVKDMGGTYTLQVGSYSSRAKAESLAGELQRNSFPARVVQE